MLIAVLLIYGTGSFTLKKYTPDWMMYLWHLLHIISIGVLILMGIYYLFSGILTIQIHNIAKTLFELLISPVAYIGIGILNTLFLRGVKNAHKSTNYN